MRVLSVIGTTWKNIPSYIENFENEMEMEVTLSLAWEVYALLGI